MCLSITQHSWGLLLPLKSMSPLPFLQESGSDLKADVSKHVFRRLCTKVTSLGMQYSVYVCYFYFLRIANPMSLNNV
jgi:hypothetical protein